MSHAWRSRIRLNLSTKMTSNFIFLPSFRIPVLLSMSLNAWHHANASNDPGLSRTILDFVGLCLRCACFSESSLVSVCPKWILTWLYNSLYGKSPGSFCSCHIFWLSNDSKYPRHRLGHTAFAFTFKNCMNHLKNCSQQAQLPTLAFYYIIIDHFSSIDLLNN